MIDTYSAIKSAGQTGAGALIGYLPVGFPDLETSVEAAVALVESGVDVLELGLPYSDPVMDGAVIQQATIKALAEGFRVADVFTAIRQIRARVSAPILIMAYWNLIISYGVERFASDLKDAGGQGLITPDLIPDEAGEWIRISDELGLDRVFLAAPTSSDERIDRVISSSRGFVYTVSTMGVTGTRADVDGAARELTERLRAAGAPASCVGLGISTARQVSEVLEYSDGAIVGSAFVKALADGGVPKLREVATELSAGKNPGR